MCPEFHCSSSVEGGKGGKDGGREERGRQGPGRKDRLEAGQGKGGSQTEEAGLRRGAFAALSISGLSSTSDPRGPAHQ